MKENRARVILLTDAKAVREMRDYNVCIILHVYVRILSFEIKIDCILYYVSTRNYNVSSMSESHPVLVVTEHPCDWNEWQDIFF